MVTSKTGIGIMKQLFNILSDDNKKSFLNSNKSEEKSEQSSKLSREL